MDSFVSDPRTTIPEKSTHLPAFFLFLLMCWGLVNFTQAIVSPISEDEAYYWMYSRYLDWGYFDHPPMISLFIKTGLLFFQGGLGTRIISILAQLACLTIVWIIIRQPSTLRKNILLYFGIGASMVMFQVTGFFATPDAPLLLFTSLFLLGYQRFLKKESVSHILLLALSMAGMIYSKYHGILVIVFVFLSNPRLIFNWKCWLACLLGSLLFLPHILWQVNHDFPTLQYHLITRARPLLLRNILEYWPNQFLIFNPVFLGMAVYVMFRFKPKELFDRSLYFISAGFLLFFFAASFRGHIEPHWTNASCLAMFILVYKHCTALNAFRIFAYRFLFPTILLLLVLRLTLIFDLFPKGLKVHGQKEWCSVLGELAGDRPVVFFNSYQHPSLYTYYTGKPATSLDGVSYKRTQYDLWNFDEKYVGKEVILVAGEEIPGSLPLAFPHGRKKYMYTVDNFITTRQIQITYDLSDNIMMKSGDSMRLNATIYNPYPFAVDFKDIRLPVAFEASFIKNGKLASFAKAKSSPEIDTIESNERISVNIDFLVPDLPPGKYFFGLVLKTGVIDGTFNSKFIPVHLGTNN